jgi:hypothetical protein
MFDLDQAVMTAKLQLRAYSKPNDHKDLWEFDGFEEGTCIATSDLPLSGYKNYTVTIDIAEINSSPLYAEYALFDDYGEWEFKLMHINYKFKTLK